jgi:hypothetical protein
LAVVVSEDFPQGEAEAFDGPEFELAQLVGSHVAEGGHLFAAGAVRKEGHVTGGEEAIEDAAPLKRVRVLRGDDVHEVIGEHLREEVV